MVFETSAGQEISHLHKVSTPGLVTTCPPPPFQWVAWPLSPRLKQPEHEADKPHKSRATVTNTFHAQPCLHSVIRDILTYTFTWLGRIIIVDIFYGSIALVGSGLLIIEASRSHSDTPHSVELLWMRDRPVAEPFTRQHSTLTSERHPCLRRNSNPQFQQASGCRPAP